MIDFATDFINIHKVRGNPCMKTAAQVLTVQPAILLSALVKKVRGLFLFVWGFWLVFCFVFYNSLQTSEGLGSAWRTKNL